LYRRDRRTRTFGIGRPDVGASGERPMTSPTAERRLMAHPTEVAMNPKSYETLASQHLDQLRREAIGGQRLATAGRPHEAADGVVSGWVERVRSVLRGRRFDAAGPGRDLGPARRPKLGQDVLDVAARGLGSDPQ
jgi:hypothetical protein